MTADFVKFTFVLTDFTIFDVLGLHPPLATSISEDQSKEFVQVDWMMSQRDTEEHIAGDQILTVSLNTLRFSSNRSAILDLVDWVQASIPSQLQNAQEVKENENMEAVKQNMNQRKELNSSTQVIVRVSKVSLQLYDEIANMNVAELTLGRTYVKYSENRTNRLIQGAIGAVSILDLRPDVPYVKILAFKGDHTLNFMYQSTTDGRDRFLRLRLGSVRFIYIKEFLQAFIDHFKNFRHTKKILEVSAESAEIIRQDLADPSRLFKLEILVNNPEVLYLLILPKKIPFLHLFSLISLLFLLFSS